MVKGEVWRGGGRTWRARAHGHGEGRGGAERGGAGQNGLDDGKARQSLAKARVCVGSVGPRRGQGTAQIQVVRCREHVHAQTLGKAEAVARWSGQQRRGHGVLKARQLGAVAEQGTARLCKVRQRMRGTRQAQWQRLGEHEKGLMMRHAHVAWPRRGGNGKVGACVKRARPVVASLRG